MSNSVTGLIGPVINLIKKYRKKATVHAKCVQESLDDIHFFNQNDGQKATPEHLLKWTYHQQQGKLANRDTGEYGNAKTECFPRLDPAVPIQPSGPNFPLLMVVWFTQVPWLHYAQLGIAQPCAGCYR